MEVSIISPKKLIEVALPLDAINAACAREKTIRHGHPSNLHRWWARRPLAAARAVIFAQLVNDPASLWENQHPGKVPSTQQRGAFTKRRRELFSLIKQLVDWENTNSPEVLERARMEIRSSWSDICKLNTHHPDAANLFDPNKLPFLHDPFAGGGAIPLEAQRLGIEARATDLNPVAVLINKAMAEIPPRFAGIPPISRHAESRDAQKKLNLSAKWGSYQGLSEDVRFYGEWLRDEARKRLSHLYPEVEVTKEMATERPDLVGLIGKKLTVIAWIWARTVQSPHPAFSNVEVPLASSFILARKQGQEAYVEPIVRGSSYQFVVRKGQWPQAAAHGTKVEGRGANFRCLVSNSPVSGAYIKAEGKAGRIGSRLMAIVAKGPKGRVYLSPSQDMENVAKAARPSWLPDVTISGSTQYLGCKPYGMESFYQLFTPRQLVSLTTFADLIDEVSLKVRNDALAAGFSDDVKTLDDGGAGATAYSNAIAAYLALVLSKTADSNNALCPWEPVAQCPRQLFGRQAVTMIWDYAEANPLQDASGGFVTSLDVSVRAFEVFPTSGALARARQADAAHGPVAPLSVVSTDPPYYDNVPYADLSDFFYVWLRKAIKGVFPALFSTVAVPKIDELVAFAYRHEGKGGAEAFFLSGMTTAMQAIARAVHPAFPTTIYYAFKQAETDGEGTASTGWETFLEAVFKAGFALRGTWPLRTESTVALKTVRNALASSIVLVCAKRAADAPSISRREFIREINSVLPVALDEMTKGAGDDRSPVAPVDLSQAIIGPGMAVFSKYQAVLEADGTEMTVRTALQLINRFLAEEDFDSDSQFCLHWFEQNGWSEGPFGEADVLARSKSTSVDGLFEAGVVEKGRGKVRLLRWDEYPNDWDPASDKRLPIWEALHHLIRALKQGGETAAGLLLGHLSPKAEAVRQLAYRLYTLSERQGWAEDARAYNELITSWTGIELVASARVISDLQLGLFGEKT
jgi:putative DNA methylase